MANKGKQRPSAPSDSDPGPGTETLDENLDAEIPEVEPGGDGTDPTVMEVKMKGSASGVRNAARKLSGGDRPPAPRPVDDEHGSDDPVASLLADGKNMVIVTRQEPRSIRNPHGEKIVTNVRISGKYTCPTTIQRIEEQVFGEHGGSRYKCTIHPDTSTGESQILGHFTIEHPDPSALPTIEGVTDAEDLDLSMEIPNGNDPTARETDSLAKMKESLQRRLDRAQQMKEIRELEKAAKMMEREMESDGKPPIAPSGPDPRDAEIARLRAELSEKKIDDRFTMMQQSINAIADSVKALAQRPVETRAAGGDESLVMKILGQSQNHSKEIVELVKNMSKPSATGIVPVSPEDSFDKMLGRLAKMKEAFGGGDSRVTRFQDQLLEMAMERAMGGGDGDGEEEDTLKFAIKQMTPVLKTYVEKQVEKEGGGGKDGKQEVSKERLKQIYDEAATKAAKDLAAQWQKEGLLIRAPGSPALTHTGKKPAIPARHVPPGRVVGRTKTSEGIVEHVQVQPTDLSGKRGSKGSAPSTEAAPRVEPASSEEPKGDEKMSHTEMPGVGRVEIPAPPGEMAYDRKKAVDYVLNSMLSEISEGKPAQAAADPKREIESFVPADALEYLDDELLREIYNVTSGDEMEGVLGKWGSREKLDAIKAAGEKDKAVDAWVRRMIRTIQEIWKDRQQG